MKVLFIASIANKRNRLDGETIKNKVLINYLKEQDGLEIISVDTDNFRKHVIKLSFLILLNLLRCEKVIISSADVGSHLVLNFLRIFKIRKEVYYFVIGGSLYNNILNYNWNVKTYSRIKKIYVEASKLRKDLNSININNVSVVNNFRKIDNFNNLYKKTKRVKFVFYGRVIKEKGVEEAIKLVNKLNDEGILCSLDIYGQVKDEYLAEIKKEFTNCIEYKGVIKTNNKIEYETLSYYDIFILPTEYQGECLPGALIDAYISGLAVVASDWPYAREYIHNNKNGIIFEYKNYNDMHYKTKDMIINNKVFQFKQESLKISKKYDVNNVLRNVISEIRGYKK